MPRPMPLSIAGVLRGADPAREALVTRSGRWSYGELDALANRAAHALADLGIRPGDRVAASLPNDVEVVAAFHGAMRVGAIWVGINRALAAPEKEYLLRDSGASLLICGDAVPDVCPNVATLESDDDTPVDNHPDPHVPAGLAYTSGTTGYPKGAVHSQHNMLLPGAVLNATRGYDESLRKADCFALTILNMQVLSTLLVAQAGGCAIVMDRMDAGGVAEWIELERATTWNGPPALLYSLAHDDGIDASALKSLREVWTGGADCPETIREAFTAKFGLDVVATYGLSEAPTVVSIDPPGGGHAAGGSGRPLPHLDVTADAEGEIVVGPATVGEWAGAYRPMLGYWERDQSPVVDGRLHTGDVGSLDDEGFVHIRDRKNLVIVRGGANVYPAEVERVLNAVDGVAASAVGGVADERLGERVVAFVELAPGANVTAEALVQICRANLAKYKVPERITLIDAFPRNSMGKIIRREIF